MECSSRFQYHEFKHFLKIFWIFSCFLNVFRQQRPWDLLHSVIISCCIVSRVNGIVDSSFSNIWIKFKLQTFCKIFLFQAYGSSWSSETISGLKRILDSLLRQWNGSQGIFVLNFSKILLKFAFFSISLSFSELNDHYWPTKLFKSQRWITWQNFWDQKMVLIFFYCGVKNFF